jgi:hypothetical protein
MKDFLGRLAAKAVGAAPVLRPRTLPIFASPARDFAPAIIEEVSEVEVRPAGGEQSRTAGRFALGDRGAHNRSDPGDLLVEGDRVVGRAEAERAPSSSRLPSEMLPSERESAAEAQEEQEPLVVLRPLLVEQPPAAPSRRTSVRSRAKGPAAPGRPPSQPAEAVARGETESAEAPLADDPFSAPVPRFAPPPRGGPAQPPADESVEVRLSIGRLEVHGPPPPAPPPAPRQRPSHRLSLQDYLGRYQGGRRGE